MSSIFSSTKNTRALPVGGLRYIRSDYPAAITENEIKWLSDNDITTVIDLRDETEYKNNPCRLEGHGDFSYYHMPVTGGGKAPSTPEEVGQSYLAMIDGNMESIINAIVNAKTGVLYFCSAGKDRTGVVSAAILKRLGVDDRTIIKDYMESKANLYGYLKEYAGSHPDTDFETIVPKEENIKRILDVI